MMHILIGSLAGLISGIAGSMGLGGGSVLIIYLTLFAGVEQLTAQGINLIFFIPIAVVAVCIYSKRKIIKWKTIFPIILFGILGTITSGIAVSFFDTTLIRKIFGGFIIAYGIYSFFSDTKKRKA